MEVRGVGAVHVPFRKEAEIFLAVRLVEREWVERLPEPAYYAYDGVSVPLICLHAFDASAPAKLRLLGKAIFSESRQPLVETA